MLPYFCTEFLVGFLVINLLLGFGDTDMSVLQVPSFLFICHCFSRSVGAVYLYSTVDVCCNTASS
jgi:hypothetical protein